MKDMMAGDWVIREGPEIKVGDFGMYSGELMPNPLTIELGKIELQNALAFRSHAIFVEDVTDSHITAFDPFQGGPVILQRSDFAGTWRLASLKQVEATWTLAKKLCPQMMVPILEATMKNFPYRDRRKGGNQ